MFAGAAREAVFSRADVIRRIDRDFVPVALKAALVNNPPAGIEGNFLREIARSKPAPQGICVANPAGKALVWALSFDEPASVPRFLDHALERFRAVPDAAKPVDTERYMKFAGQPLPEIRDTLATLPDTLEHSRRYCPATPPRERGTVVARVWGRAVGEDGALAGACHRQENYVEDLFDIPPAVQADIARAVRTAGPGERFRLSGELATLLATHAYLGQLDVRPVQSPVPDHRGEIRTLEFWVRPVDSAESASSGDKTARVTLRLTGRSDVGARSPGRRGDGASYIHDIALEWYGFITLAGDRIAELDLHASGREKLWWANPALRDRREDDVAHLPAGRFIDVDGEVRYGIVGRPIPDDQAWSGEGPPPPAPGIGGPPPELRPKIERVQRRARELARAGHDLRPFQRQLQRFATLMQQGRRREAEAALDAAAALLERAAGQAPAAEEETSTLPPELREKLRELRGELERLVREGKEKKARRMIDRVLERARQD